MCSTGVSRSAECPFQLDGLDELQVCNFRMDGVFETHPAGCTDKTLSVVRSTVLLVPTRVAQMFDIEHLSDYGRTHER